jgi:hypothetical protein
MSAFEAPSTESLGEQVKEKVDFNVLLRNPNFDAEHCESSILFKIDQVELDNELERLKKKILRYELSIKDRPLEFVGYTNLRKTEEKLAENTDSRASNLNRNESDSKKSDSKKEDEPINRSNEYDLEILKRVIFKS